MNPFLIRRLDITASTNDDIKSAAESGEAEGLVIHALKQTAGRGRHGRTWQSPEGNLYCSVLLRPTGTQNFGQYSFVASLALADTVKTFLPHAEVTLKWPNDVLVSGKKISGILLESGDGYLVIGMGLNVLHHPDNALYPSTSLIANGADLPPSPRGRGWGRGRDDGLAYDDKNQTSEMLHAPSPNLPLEGGGTPAVLAEKALPEILDILLNRLWCWYETMQKSGFGPIRAAWLETAQKGSMSVKLPGGIVEGIFKTIDEQGHLILRLADGAERAIATGDVFFTARE